MRIRTVSTSSTRTNASLDFDYSESDHQVIYQNVDLVKEDIKRKLPQVYHENNVLVFGAHNVGKSSLINSIWLAMTGESQERSPPVGVTFYLGQHKL